ncbi:MAG: DUF4399 domain-containing protein [Wenzhouxiangellaceae bacterium]
MKCALIAMLTLLTLSAPAQELERTPAPDGANVYIISPAHGEVVSNPVTVRFGLSEMGVAPAGIKADAAGHHHLLINVADDAMPPFNRPLPATDRIRHFGGGQTEVVLELPPGPHTLQLLLGDHLHIPHDPPVISKPISIIVR